MMKQNDELQRLRTLSSLVFGLRMNELLECSKRRHETMRLIARMSDQARVEGLDLAGAARVELRYAHWADNRKQQLNILLAQQTAEWLCARQSAMEAFGRDSVVAKLKKP